MTPLARRMTTTTVLVLEVLTQDVDTARYGLEIMATTGPPSGTVLPVLARFETLGWPQSDWEEIDARTAGRPRRRYCRLTSDGLARDEHGEPRRRSPSPGPARSGTDGDGSTMRSFRSGPSGPTDHNRGTNGSGALDEAFHSLGRKATPAPRSRWRRAVPLLAVIALVVVAGLTMFALNYLQQSPFVLWQHR